MAYSINFLISISFHFQLPPCKVNILIYTFSSTRIYCTFVPIFSSASLYMELSDDNCAVLYLSPLSIFSITFLFCSLSASPDKNKLKLPLYIPQNPNVLYCHHQTAHFSLSDFHLCFSLVSDQACSATPNIRSLPAERLLYNL